MRFGMALLKNEHGVLHVLRKVPKGLEVPAARVMGAPKERVSWLMETLRKMKLDRTRRAQTARSHVEARS